MKKADGSYRVCVNFKELNKITVFDPEPMMSLLLNLTYFLQHIYTVCLFFSALHGMPARISDEKAVCLSVFMSVCPSNA